MSEPSFSERMRAQARPTWEAILDHRFFREIAADTVEESVFARYLGVEYAFVDTAAAALGYAVAKAPSFAERRHLALGLHGLVTEQEQFFVRAFAAMGVKPRPQGERDPLSAPLHDLFLTVARDEGYEEILACTLAAEWMYLTWCSAAAKAPSARRPISDWVALHAGGPFAESVAWLRGEIDRKGPRLPPARQSRLLALFEQALAAEIPFHDAAYSQ